VREIRPANGIRTDLQPSAGARTRSWAAEDAGLSRHQRVTGAMLTRTKPRPADPAAIAIEPIGDNPEYRVALAELTALEKRLAETEKRRLA
jgi:hypothetical protein